MIELTPLPFVQINNLREKRKASNQDPSYDQLNVECYDYKDISSCHNVE
jgi:hypothetical protein